MAVLHLSIILALVGQTTCTAQSKLLRGASHQSWTKLWRGALAQHGTPANELEYSSDDDPDMTFVVHDDPNMTKSHDEEDLDDAKAWKFGRPVHYLASGAQWLPPKCPKDVPASSPWFTELVTPHGHVDCEFRSPCNKQGTNLERLNSIRGVLGRMKTLLNGLNINYAIYAGSAIGQERCEDVLPWDGDCDVAVWEEDIPRIATGHLDSQYVVKTKGIFIPRTLADKRTGFYCDIFPLKNKGAFVETPWPWGNAVCPGQAMRWVKSPTPVKKCYRAPYNIVAPFVPCTLNGVQHTCMKDQLGFLKLRYGAGVLHPNVSVSNNPKGEEGFDWIFDDP